MSSLSPFLSLLNAIIKPSTTKTITKITNPISSAFLTLSQPKLNPELTTFAVNGICSKSLPAELIETLNMCSPKVDSLAAET